MPVDKMLTASSKDEQSPGSYTHPIKGDILYLSSDNIEFWVLLVVITIITE